MTTEPVAKTWRETFQSLNERLLIAAQNLVQWFSKAIGAIIGFLLIIAGSLSFFALGVLLFYGADSIQQFAMVALASCLCWLLAHSIYQTIRAASKSASRLDRDSLHWTFTPRTISLVMAILTAIIFGGLVLYSFNIVLPFLIIAPFVLFFPFSYMAYSAFQRPFRVKRLRSDFELLTAQWDEELYQQYTSFSNYALHISLAILVTLLGIFVVFMPLFTRSLSEGGGSNVFMSLLPIWAFDTNDTNELIGITVQVQRAMAFGFLGSLLFSFYYVYRRYTTSDLQPSVYLYCAITIMLGLVFNYIAFRALDGLSGTPESTREGVVAGLVDILSFAVGFFPILAVQWLTNTVYRAFGQPRRRSDMFPLDQLDGISQSQEIRLRDFGIDDAQNLASTEMPLLLINTPFPVQTVVDWVDQAVLMVLLNNVNTLDSFRKAHVRTMTDFRDLWGPYAERERTSKRERDVAALASKAEADKMNAEKLQETVEVKIAEIDKKLEALAKRETAATVVMEQKLSGLKDEQTEVANALNSNIHLLRALYNSTNFDMNVHYLTNYRKNVELLLPGWTSARYNRYLLEAQRIKLNPTPWEKSELARLWKLVNTYLESNQQIQADYERDHDETNLGSIVEPTSVEAYIGLARLYRYQETQVRETAQKQDYLTWAETEYANAFREILQAITNIGSRSTAIQAEPGWSQLHQAASEALEIQIAKSSASPNQKAVPAPGETEMVTMTQPAAQITPAPAETPVAEGNGSHGGLPQTENKGSETPDKPEDGQ